MLSFSGLKNWALPCKCHQALGMFFFFRNNIHPTNKRSFEGDALFIIQGY
jgi:hypothetical protein